jgi:chromosome segregation ATPase
MTTFSKVLAVIASVACFAFLGFVAVATLGGTNWEAEMEAADLKNYVFSREEGETATTWSAKRIVPDESVASATKIAPDVVVKTRQDLKSRQEDESAKLDDGIQDIEARLKEAREVIALDEPAVIKRLNELQQELDGINKQIDDVTKAGQQMAQQAKETQDEATKRHEDVMRLTAELEQLRTDRYRAIEQQRILRDHLVRIRGTNDELQRRNKELKESGASLK